MHDSDHGKKTFHKTRKLEPAGSAASRVYGESYSPPPGLKFKPKARLDSGQVRDVRSPRAAAIHYGAFLGKPQPQIPDRPNTIGGPVRDPSGELTLPPKWLRKRR